ncbi:hypothetical protein CRUP_037161, partial [Coryphaenoides rupestris]
VKMNRMRLRIASRLKEAQNTCAMLTTFNEIDMRGHFEGFFPPPRKCAVSAFGYSGFSRKTSQARAHLEPKERARAGGSSICTAVGGNISEMRKAYKDGFLKKHNTKLGFMSAFVKAAAYALRDQPTVNAGTADESRSTLVSGLVVPVIRGVEGMNFAEIEKTINMLGEK